jgi:hypothetical protein
MSQVVVAVLLEKFFQATEQGDEHEMRAQALAEAEHPLDFLLVAIARHFEDQQGLNRLFDDMFRLFDHDKSGSLSFAEFAEGVHVHAEAQGLRPPALSENYFPRWGTQQEHVNQREFREVMWVELRR